MATIFCQRELEFCCECMAGLVWLTIPIGLSGSSAILNVRSCQNLPLGLPEATGGKRWRISNGRSLPCLPNDRQLNGSMLRLLPLFLLLSVPPAMATDDEDFDPSDVSIVDAINCHLNIPTYNSFAAAIDGEDGLAARFGWRKIEAGNPFLAEFELPKPELITGHWSTRRVAFSSTGVLAILDVPDPEEIARAEEIGNELETSLTDEELADAAAEASPEALAAAKLAIGGANSDRNDVEPPAVFRKFLGQRVLADVTVPAKVGDSFGTRAVIARSISNVTSHPGKTLYGCSYRIELLDRDGKPL